MAFKDLLLVLTTYPEPTPVSAVDNAVDIELILESKLSAIACAVSLHVPLTYTARYCSTCRRWPLAKPGRV
jgi:hypothetical protein